MTTAFFIRNNGRFQLFPLEEVLYIVALKNYCNVFTTKKAKYLITLPLSCLEHQLPENLFCRIHRSYIISVRKIQWFDHRHVCLNDEQLPLNKEGYQEIIKRVVLLGSENDKKIKEEIGALSVEEYVRRIQKHRKDV